MEAVATMRPDPTTSVGPPRYNNGFGGSSWRNPTSSDATVGGGWRREMERWRLKFRAFWVRVANDGDNKGYIPDS